MSSFSRTVETGNAILHYWNSQCWTCEYTTLRGRIAGNILTENPSNVDSANSRSVPLRPLKPCEILSDIIWKVSIFVDTSTLQFTSICIMNDFVNVVAEMVTTNIHIIQVSLYYRK
jgi:hypothetical protein